MHPFITELKCRNEILFYYGLFCLILSFSFLILSMFSDIQINNVSAWIKPFKFAFSTFLFSWAMAWYCHYLPNFEIRFFNWTVIIMLGFEIIYIAIQAGRGQLSHFNLSSPLYSALYTSMAIAASVVTIYTAHVGILFFQNDFPNLEKSYLWGIRFGIIIFVIFSFEGFVMGSRLTHTIGGRDGSEGLPFLHWSLQYGDPRVAHFIGMHALQILPLLSFYVLKDLRWVFFFSILYGFLAVFTLLQALQGKPFLKKIPNFMSSQKKTNI